MFSQQLAPLARSSRCASRRLLECRAFSSTPRRAVAQDANAEETDQPVESQAGLGDLTYRQFLQSVAARFRNAETQNWLAPGTVSTRLETGSVRCLNLRGQPFPMNPSFRPPPPIADAQREAMYRAYMSDPVKNDVRALSQRYNLSIKRVDAILRLKGLERAWRKVSVVFLSSLLMRHKNRLVFKTSPTRLTWFQFPLILIVVCSMISRY